MCFNLYTAHNCDVPDDEMTQELMVDEEPEEDYDEMPDLSDDKLSTMYTYEDKGAPGASMYGTHQLQLKRDTRVPRVCRPRNAHALLLHACSFVCFYLLHHEHVRKHTRYVCMNTHSKNKCVKIACKVCYFQPTKVCQNNTIYAIIAHVCVILV